jgi:hypothetical protein
VGGGGGVCLKVYNSNTLMIQHVLSFQPQCFFFSIFDSFLTWHNFTYGKGYGNRNPNMTLKEEILNCFEHFSMADIDFTDTNLVTKTL